MVRFLALATLSILSVLGSVKAVATAPKEGAVNSDFVFNFNNASADAITSGSGGQLVSSNVLTFPILQGQGIALGVGTIEPCGISLPHLHLRANEFAYVAEGALTMGFFEDNKATKPVLNKLVKGQAHFFPQGSIHYAQNLGCQKAVFVAAFNDERPGFSTVVQNLFQLPDDVVSTAFGGVDAKTLKTLKNAVPKSPALGTAECKKRCGL